MIDDDICILREKLHSLILENADYDKVLKLSQELDKIITEFIYEKLDDTYSEK